MKFSTRINGIPCQCRVDHFSPAVPMRVYGSGMGDADPPEPAEFAYTILDRNGREAPWLSKYITPEVDERLFEEFEVESMYERHNPY